MPARRYIVGAVVLSEPELSVLRSELKRMSPDVRIEIERGLVEELLKRDVLEGDKAVEAKRRLAKAAAKLPRKNEKDEAGAKPLAVATAPATPAANA